MRTNCGRARPCADAARCRASCCAGSMVGLPRWRRYKRSSLMTSNVVVTKESTGLISRFVLVVFCLAAGFAYRASVSLVPIGILEDSFLLGLAALFLIVAVLTRRSQNLRRYWEIPFAFFV